MPEVSSHFIELVRECTDLELVAMRADLRHVPEDKPYLDVVEQEIGVRARRKAKERGKQDG